MNQNIIDTIDFRMLKNICALKNQGTDLNTAIDPESGHTYLQEAASRGFANSVQFLLQNNVDPNYTPNDVSPLMLATQNGHVKVMDLLLQHKADMHAVFYDVILDIPETPFTYATSNNMVAAVELFMKYGAPYTEGELEALKQRAKEDDMIRTRRFSLSQER